VCPGQAVASRRCGRRGPTDSGYDTTRDVIVPSHDGSSRRWAPALPGEPLSGPRRIRAATAIRGGLLALTVAAVTVGLQYQRQQDPHIRYSRWNLPAFDAWVYVAMAEHPAFFTVAPWGYRALTPWVVSAFPVPKVIHGFRGVTTVSLVVAGGLLFVFLRRLGHSEWAALLGVAAFGLSPPIAELLGYMFLADPLTLALLLAFLVALEAGGGLGVLCLLMALGAFSKEIFLLLVPLVFLVGHEREGARKALTHTLVVALVGAAATLLLRWWWAPQEAASDVPGLNLEAVSTAAYDIAGAWGDWWQPLLLWGVTPLALIGAFRANARPYLKRYGYLAVLTGLLPFAAGVYAGEAGLVDFFSADVPRLLVYALPFWIPLALLALAPLVPRPVPPAPRPLARGVEVVAGLLTFALLAAPLLALDRYRRVHLGQTRDGPLVLSVSRESLRTARRLARGEAVSFDAVGQRFVWGESDPAALRRMRWFLRDGWGQKAHYGSDDIELREPQATLLLPCFEPQSLEAAFVLEAPQHVELAAFVNGQPVGDLHAGPSTAETSVRIPAQLLFRGDNLLSLAVKGPTSRGIRLRRLTYRPGSDGP